MYKNNINLSYCASTVLGIEQINCVDSKSITTAFEWISAIDTFV